MIADRKRKWFAIEDALEQLSKHKPVQLRYLHALINYKHDPKVTWGERAGCACACVCVCGWLCESPFLIPALVPARTNEKSPTETWSKFLAGQFFLDVFLSGNLNSRPIVFFSFSAVRWEIDICFNFGGSILICQKIWFSFESTEIPLV